ncbi:MAG TPA: hypothetical protein VFU03_03050 [Gemmatimonadales bacterium]|nr:hypothetical protein [Gemmatimonadales bacterium]
MALGGLLSGCSALSPSEPILPAGATEIPIPASYLEWHAKTEACSGLKGEFSTIKFYVVPGVETFSTADGAKVGEWTSDGVTSRIVIAGNYQNFEMVVRHELLHSLLRKEGHPTEYFVDRCHLTWESWNGPQGGAPPQLGE